MSEQFGICLFCGEFVGNVEHDAVQCRDSLRTQLALVRERREMLEGVAKAALRYLETQGGKKFPGQTANDFWSRCAEARVDLYKLLTALDKESLSASVDCVSGNEGIAVGIGGCRLGKEKEGTGNASH